MHVRCEKWALVIGSASRTGGFLQVDFDEDEGLVLATDGLWDVLSDEDAARIVLQHAYPCQLAFSLVVRNFM